MLTRRDFLARTLMLGAGLALTPVVGAGNRSPLLLSASDDGNGGHFFSAIDEMGAPRFSHPLPDRAHGIALHPARTRCAVVARRPGTFVDLYSLPDGRQLQRLHNPDGRRFCGHAAFSADGRTLYTTENDFDGRRGVIGVWRLRDGLMVRETEWASGGVGPHEVLLHPNGSLVVANGGILTHPDRGRDKLNLDSMQANLTYLDSETGAILGSYGVAAELHQLSIRHLSISPDGRVASVLQYQGPETEEVPLLVLHSPGDGALQLLRLPEGPERHRNYLGSVAWDLDGRWLAMSAPRGSRIYFYHRDSAAWADPVTYSDGCGLYRDSLPATFLISSGAGGVTSYCPEDGSWQPMPDRYASRQHWDNHMVVG
ncbi:Tat pathway signal protein [Marinobacterium nitratireducens]|uniref:Tat pathway signal protein n=1 Tax=Marinobacterium nitratireducens TaxID=518897 RepID=A0A917ZFA5_9GAMM|nr:DUF1513 domain-containing protein [Marinobacterium nitratireducens]GGO81472.1 Tat pathway signal protein [Marinobacterium nitratireducens]